MGYPKHQPKSEYLTVRRFFAAQKIALGHGSNCLVVVIGVFINKNQQKSTKINKNQQKSTRDQQNIYKSLEYQSL